MKIYIHADMEGASGIYLPQQVEPGQARFDNGRALLMADINAAVRAAKDAGATGVVVCDTHTGGFGGGQLDLDKMAAGAQYESWDYSGLLPALDESFAGVILLAHHAKAGTLGGFLDHTIASATIFDYRINGVSVGEIGVEAAYAGHFGVPVIMVSGDDKTAVEARALLGEVECAVVKTGLSRNRARCLAPADAHALLRAAVQRALGSPGRFRPFRPTLPAVVEVTYARSDYADEAAAKPGCERVDGRTVRRTLTALRDL